METTFMNFLVKLTFKQQMEEEFKEIIDMFKDFFIMIKEVTYDIAVKAVGGEVVNLFIIAIVIVAVGIVCISLINR